MTWCTHGGGDPHDRPNSIDRRHPGRYTREYHPSVDEISVNPFVGGCLNRGKITLLDNTVIRRQSHPWPRDVGRSLAALSRSGFDRCPQVLHQPDDKTAILTYMPGHALPDPVPAWAAQPGVLHDVTLLCRQFSDAAQTVPSPHRRQEDWASELPSSGGTFLHGDLHPSNIVFDEAGKPTAIIDFELATVGPWMWNLTSLLFSWTPFEPVDLTCWRSTPWISRVERCRQIITVWQFAENLSAIGDALLEFMEWRYLTFIRLARAGNEVAATHLDPSERAVRTAAVEQLVAEVFR
jgi:hypothetical protein